MKPGPAALSWLRVLPLDASLALGIVAVALAVLLAHVPALLDKARLAEVLVQLGTARVDAMEHIALRGELRASPAAQSPIDTVGGHRYRRSGTGLVAAGVLRAGEPGFELAFHPALDEAGQGWSVIWLCGQRRAPAGWTSAAPPLGAPLDTERLPFVCRHTETP